MSQVSDVIQAKPRTTGNKGIARRLRASGWVPAVAYGPKAETQALALDPKAFLETRREHGLAHIYDVQVEGKGSFKALIKEVQRDPLSRQLQHVDLFAIDMTKPIRVRVRIDLVGKSKGVALGGLLQHLLRRVELRGLPDKIPGHIELDVTEMEVGDIRHLSDLTLPEGVAITASRDEAVVSVIQPEGEPEAPAEEAEAVEGAAAAPEGAAPAAEEKA